MSETPPPNGQQSDEGGAKAYAPPATQAELDRIVESRLARERAKFADYDDLKSKASEFETWQQSQLSEQEKAVQAARDEGRQEAATQYERKLVSTEVRLQASALGFHDPADALAQLGDELPMKDGEPDAEAIKAALAEIATNKPYLVKGADREPIIPKGRPKLPAGEKRTTQDGKGRAAAALRQLGAQKHR